MVHARVLWVYEKSLCFGVSVLRVRVYHDPKPVWGIISVELLWSLRSGINSVTSPELSLGDDGSGG